MGESISATFKSHELQVVGPCFPSLTYENPEGSHWKATRKKRVSSPRKFVADVRSVENTEKAGDAHWHAVIEPANLALAWARARNLAMREVIYDEIEIRLFERNLEARLSQLRNELMSYPPSVARTEDRLHFSFVKNRREGRPRVLARLEEEIVSVAIIQKLGSTAFGLNEKSYAYRPTAKTRKPSEYLYEYWFANYRSYVDDTEDYVERLADCSMLNIDIKSYFGAIPQRGLLDSVVQELRSQSHRIRWLLERFLLVELIDHDPETGLAQGGAGSGFYANAYLTPFDSKFGLASDLKARLFRFVDDIVVVVPDSEGLSTVLGFAREMLESRGLELNDDKTRCFTRAEYLDLPRDRTTLEDLSRRFETLSASLWLTNESYRHEFARHKNWWAMVRAYQRRLRTVGAYMDAGRLSRKLHQYQSKRKRQRDKWRTGAAELCLPSLYVSDWALEFSRNNPVWIQERNSLRNDLAALVSSSHSNMDAKRDSEGNRIIRTRIYFAANRTSRLGFGRSADMIRDILRDQPWIIRQPQFVLRGFAMQGLAGHLESLFAHYKDQNTPWAHSFLAVILRALRHLDSLPDQLQAGTVDVALDNRYQTSRILIL